MYATHSPGDHSRWKGHTLFAAHDLPAGVRPWLLDSGSLTRRLVRASDGHFSVQVITHRWARPRLDEARLLDMDSRQRAIVREVALLCYGEPWVFARSVIPAQSLRGRLRRLRNFSDSSLGELLFRDTSMRRWPFQLARIEGNSRQIPPFLRCDQRLWGRRCRFEVAARPLLVSEIFLPAFRP